MLDEIAKLVADHTSKHNGEPPAQIVLSPAAFTYVLLEEFGERASEIRVWGIPAVIAQEHHAGAAWCYVKTAEGALSSTVKLKATA